MPEKARRETRTIHIFTEKFTEGEWHVFRVAKTIAIPGEDLYYLLESKQGNRMLMPTKYYSNYGITIGESIHCRVDKINCSGKIYLEPEHPYLNIGHRYDFRILDKREFIDRKGRMKDYFLLTGPNDMQFESILSENISPPVPSYIRATLIRIRKGILMLNEIELINNC